jgi:hypothetical protein
MDFLSNIFHGIGDFVGGLLNGNNNDQRKRQQQQQQSFSAPAPQSSVQPGFHSALPGVVTQTTTQAPAVNLYQAPAANQLQKPAAPRPTPAQPQQPFAAPAQLTRPLPTVGQITGIQTPQAPSTGPGFNPVNWVADNIVKPTADVAGKVANTGIGGIALAGNALSAGADQLFRGGKNANFYQNEANAINNNFLAPGKGLFGAGGFQTGKDFETESPAQALGAGIGAGAQVAPYLIGNPEGALIDKFGNVIGDKFVNAAASTLAKKGSQYAVQGAITAPAVASANAVEQGIATGKFDPGQSIQTGLASIPAAILGSAGGDALHALGTKVGTGRPETQAILPGEAAPGVASVNPNRETDAISQMTPPAEQMPSPQEQVPAVTPEAPQPVVPPQVLATTELPRIPETAAPQQAPAAPATHDMLVKQLGDQGKGFKKNYTTRDIINLDDLKQKATGVINNMDDESLVRSFQTADPETIVTNPQSFAVARAAVERLSKNADDPASVQTVSNLLDAMDKASSRSGQMQRIVREEFDSMPVPMKARYIMKQIDKANVGDNEYVPLRDRPDEAALIDQTITSGLNKSEAIANRVSQIQDQLNQVAEAAKNGQKSDVNVGDLAVALKDAEMELGASNGELVKYYQTLVPKRSIGQKTNDFARNAMLSSFTGRVNDIATTATNMAQQSLQNTVQGAIAKGVNAFSPGKVLDTSRGTGAFWRGTLEGVGKGAREFTNEIQAGDLQKSLKNGSMGKRTQLAKSQNPLGRTIQASTEFATHASEGVRDQRLYQLAIQEAQKAGIPRNLRDQYASARAAVPSRDMLDNAQKLHDTVNNLNDNPISNKLRSIVDAIDPPGAAKKGNKAQAWAGGLLRNQILPFTSWAGGNIWNGVTDRNVVAAAVKLGNSIRKGDADGIVENLAKTAIHGGETYALGYLLSQNGTITNKDANGNSYDGLYLHAGDRYIPVAFTGFFAPSIILGHAAYQAINSGKDPASAIGDFAGNTLADWAKSASLSSVMGTDNNITRLAAVPASEPKGTSAGDTLGDTGAAAGASIINQYVPAITRDINSVLNNYTGLNPTKEAANTTVLQTNPATGNQVKDKGASAGASILNNIPVASQLALPRKQGVASADLVDRVTHGSSDTATTKQQRADAQTKADQIAADAKAGIPNPDATYKQGDSFANAVENRIENSQYDQAIAGLKEQLTKLKSGDNPTKAQTDPVEKQIKETQVLKDGNYDPAIRDLYKQTTQSQWRDMGDPNSDGYDPKTYEMLWQYQNDLVKAGLNTTVAGVNTNKYSPKAPAKGRSGSGGRGGSTSAAGGTISPVELKNISLGSLSPQKISNAPIPTIRQIKPTDLPKKRTISISKG